MYLKNDSELILLVADAFFLKKNSDLYTNLYVFQVWQIPRLEVQTFLNRIVILDLLMQFTRPLAKCYQLQHISSNSLPLSLETHLSLLFSTKDMNNYERLSTTSSSIWLCPIFMFQYSSSHGVYGRL